METIKTYSVLRNALSINYLMPAVLVLVPTCAARKNYMEFCVKRRPSNLTILQHRVHELFVNLYWAQYSLFRKTICK